MSTALKVLVCGFSFAFSAVFVTAFFSLFSATLAGAFQHRGHPWLALLCSVLPFLLGAVVGLQAARLALRLEEQRQSRAQAKKNEHKAA
jgi:hypothetical protein